MIPFLEHYVEMDKVFDLDRKWLWLLQVIVTIISIIMYFKVDGRELVFAMYIPLDIILNISTIVFFWFYYYMEKFN